MAFKSDQGISKWKLDAVSVLEEKVSQRVVEQLARYTPSYSLYLVN